MTQPLEIDALEDLALQFRRIAAEEHGTPRSSRDRRRRRRRYGLGAGIAALVLACTATAATVVLREGPPIPEAPAGDFSADQQPLPETARLAGVQTADPDGGLPWGLLVFRNAAGERCATPGRLLNGKLGKFVNGVFRELPLRGPGGCASFSATFRGRVMGFTMLEDYNPADNRTVIYGVASATVRSISLEAGLHSKTIVPGPDGAYLAVFEAQPTVLRVITYTDGTELVIDTSRRP